MHRKGSRKPAIVKTLNCPYHAASRQRLYREAVALQECAGAGVPAILASNAFHYDERGPSAKQLFIAMEPVFGMSLDKIVPQKGPMESAQALSIGIGILNVLERVHIRGWSHGDIKPDNIRLDDDHKLSVVVIDFGCATNGWGPEILIAGSEAELNTAFVELPEGTAQLERDLSSVVGLLFFLLTAVRPREIFNSSSPRLHEGGKLTAALSGVDDRYSGVFGRAFDRSVGRLYSASSELRSDLQMIAGSLE